MLKKWLLNKKNTRHPFSNPPLNLPGETLRDKLDNELFNLTLSLSFPLLLLSYTAYALINNDNLPLKIALPVQIIALTPMFLINIWYIKRTVQKIHNYRLGYLGEKIIGQELDRARSLGYSVFHDIQDEDKKFNIDHIAIGPAGIIVVETKVKSKPKKGETKIFYNGDNLLFSDGHYTSAPLSQVGRNAKWIQHLMNQLISEKKNPIKNFNDKNTVPVVNIVVYPGWYIDFSEALKNGATIKVTSDKMLVNVIKGLPISVSLNKEIITEFQNLLGEYLREKNQKIINY